MNPTPAPAPKGPRAEVTAHERIPDAVRLRVYDAAVLPWEYHLGAIVATEWFGRVGGWFGADAAGNPAPDEAWTDYVVAPAAPGDVTLHPEMCTPTGYALVVSAPSVDGFRAFWYWRRDGRLDGWGAAALDQPGGDWALVGSPAIARAEAYTHRHHPRGVGRTALVQS